MKGKRMLEKIQMRDEAVTIGIESGKMEVQVVVMADTIMV